jgi:hypothetical protein
VDITVSFREGKKVAEVILFERQILMLKKSDHEDWALGIRH